MKKMKKIILSLSTMIMAICLMVFGVFAATNQNLGVNGQIDVSISDLTGNARMAVVASMRDAETEYEVYGTKSAYLDATTFNVKNVALNEVNFYMVHKFTFTNYGDAITSFIITIEDNGSGEFRDNFDCFIGLEEKSITNESYSFVPEGVFLNAYSDEAESKDIYVFVQLKDELTTNEFICNYKISIEYQVAE